MTGGADRIMPEVPPVSKSHLLLFFVGLEGYVMKVKDIMITNVKSIHPDTPICQALEMLSKEGLSGLPVIDAHNTLLGVFTEKDIIRYILPGYVQKVGTFIYQDDSKTIKNKVNELLHQRTVAQIMRKEVITISPDASLSEAARTILIEKIRRLPVVDKDRRVIGIIARQDIVKAFVRGTC